MPRSRKIRKPEKRKQIQTEIKRRYEASTNTTRSSETQKEIMIYKKPKLSFGFFLPFIKIVNYLNFDDIRI